MAQKTGARTGWHMVLWTVARVQILLYRMGEEHMNPHLQQILHDITVRITKLEEAQQPQRTWVGLSNGEMIELSEMQLGSWDLILEVEAKLKEKNHG